MRTLTRILIPLLLAALLLAACPLSAAAAANATIAFSSSSLVVGDTLTVTVNFSADTVGAVNASLSYDASVLQFVSGDGAAGGGGVVRLATYTSTETSSLRFQLTFKALAAGSCFVQVTESTVYSWDRLLAGNPTAGASVKVTNQALSQNADLKSLQVSAGRLSPAFSAATTSYTVTVENNVSSLSISAIAADSGASVKISGESALAVGTTKRTITVTAPGGATKTYTVTITRRQATTKPPTNTSATTAPTTAAPDEPTVEPCYITQGGTRYVVATTLSDITLPEGFSVGEATVGDTTVAAAVREGSPVCLLWLTAADEEDAEGSFFGYRTGDDPLVFPYRPFSTENGVFLLLSDDATPNGGLSRAEWELGGQQMTVWTFSAPELTEFCVFRAMAPDGDVGFFRYDTAKKTAQRYVAAASSATTTLAAAAPTTAPTTTAPTTATEPLPLNGLIGWAVAGGLALVCIALAVLAIIFRRRTITPPKH